MSLGVCIVAIISLGTPPPPVKKIIVSQECVKGRKVPRSACQSDVVKRALSSRADPDPAFTPTRRPRKSHNVTLPQSVCYLPLFATSLWHTDLPSFITLLGHYNFLTRGGGGVPRLIGATDIGRERAQHWGFFEGGGNLYKRLVAAAGVRVEK